MTAFNKLDWTEHIELKSDIIEDLRKNIKTWWFSEVQMEKLSHIVDNIDQEFANKEKIWIHAVITFIMKSLKEEERRSFDPFLIAILDKYCKHS